MKNLITKVMKVQLENRLYQLKTQKSEISKRIGEARDQGDIKENSEFHAAREAMSMNLLQTSNIIAELENSEVVENMSFDGTARLNTVVEIEDPGISVSFRETLKLVSTNTDNYDEVSINSPMGKALLGHKIGDIVTFKVPRGDKTIKIIEVRKAA